MKTILRILVLFLFSAPSSAQPFAVQQLNDSPRHHEWVELRSGDRTVHTFVAYPERDTPSMAVIVIHENRGLTDWVRSMADQIAEAGYLAIAPDLLSDFDASNSRTSDFESPDAARTALYTLDPDQITNDLLAVQQYISAVPAFNGRTIVAGFCWGGTQAFRFAANSDDLDAALVFYGSAPDEEDIRNVNAPIYAFYAQNDERINATIPETEALMSGYGKTYEYEIYPGGGHGFMRSGDDPEGSAENRQARKEAWVRLKQLLARLDHY